MSKETYYSVKRDLLQCQRDLMKWSNPRFSKSKAIHSCFVNS